MSNLEKVIKMYVDNNHRTAMPNYGDIEYHYVGSYSGGAEIDAILNGVFGKTTDSLSDIYDEYYDCKYDTCDAPAKIDYNDSVRVNSETPTVYNIEDSAYIKTDEYGPAMVIETPEVDALVVNSSNINKYGGDSQVNISVVKDFIEAYSKTLNDITFKGS